MRILIATLALASIGCGGHQRKIKIPESVVANPKKKDAPQRLSEPYVVKMSDGQRVWEISIPVFDGAPVNAAIPLDLGEVSKKTPGNYQVTADGEIIEAKKAAGEKVPEVKPGEEPRSKSYLKTLARVRELFKRRQYELALVDLVELDRQYPDDERILEMKGTLYVRLNRPKEAKKAWERVLSLNPNNETVARALERLEMDGE
jgi:tetratricopeptide (TPR) repeat protein